MANGSTQIVQKLWSCGNVLRDDGLSYQDYLEVPAPHVLAAEIADDLRAALEQIEDILVDLQARVKLDARP